MKSPESGNRQNDIVREASLGQPSGESTQMAIHISAMASEAGIALLHDINHAFAAVVLNAQVLDGKLPSYSRSKRYIHEIERSAQRGAALLRRLLDRLPADESGSRDKELELEGFPPVVERTTMVASQGPNAATNGELNFARSAAARAAPDF